MTWARRCYTSPGYRRWWLSKRALTLNPDKEEG